MSAAASFLVAGAAAGTAVVLPEALSFWGGLDPETGDIIDHSHPALGRNVAGKILVMPCGRGSSSSSSVFLEAIRQGTAPVGIILERPDPILAVGAIVARSLYGVTCPVVVAPGLELRDGGLVSIAVSDDGTAVVSTGRRAEGGSADAASR